MDKSENIIEVSGVTAGYGNNVVLKDIDFTVKHGEIFVIMGGSGCGKSTLLKQMIGLYRPFAGSVTIFGQDIVEATLSERRVMMQKFGVTYQDGALFGSMTLAENVALPLEEYTDKSVAEIAQIVRDKLQQVELGEFGDYMPSEISGGMRKRAGLARAMALSPSLLFFDEPSAGLDPITSADLDSLILVLQREMKTTLVIVSHELDSIYTIADRVIILNAATKGIVASGKPRELRDNCQDSWVRDLLTRKNMKLENKI
ncbi:MAG: ATP-binding cassette domain-containing protein [Victivallaceae bacterium]|nr:ATP-binding cassette domain-containing protein [Victivallaceae bacterium]